MKKIFLKICILLLLINDYSCREEYLPPVISAGTNFLVVEGILNTGQDSTILKLSRTKNLNDTTFDIPELNASVTIEAKNGVNFLLTNKGKGIYAAPPISLNPAEMYRLRISTNSGGLYESEFVSIKPTPPIDSITWKQNTDVFLFLNTHDPANNTRFYRWDFIETWEYHAYYDSNLGYNYFTNLIYFRDSSQLLASTIFSDIVSSLIGLFKRQFHGL